MHAFVWLLIMTCTNATRDHRFLASQLYLSPFARKHRYTFFALFRFHNAPVTSNYDFQHHSTHIQLPVSTTCINSVLRQFSHQLILSFPLILDCNQALLLCAKLREAQSKVMARSPSCHFYVRNVKFWVDEGGTWVGGKANVLIPHAMQKQGNLLILLQLGYSTSTNLLTFLSRSYTFLRAAA